MKLLDSAALSSKAATGSSDGGGTSSLMKKQINIANMDAEVASAGTRDLAEQPEQPVSMEQR